MNTNKIDSPPSPFISSCDRNIHRLEILLAMVAASAIIFLMGLQTVEVVARKLFNASLYGQIDLVELSIPLYAIAAVSYVYRKSSHLRMDILIQKASLPIRWKIELLCTVLTLLVAIPLLIGSFGFAYTAWELFDTTGVTMWRTWPSKAIVPLSFFVFCLRLLLEVLIYTRLILNPEGSTAGVPDVPDPIEDILN